MFGVRTRSRLRTVGIAKKAAQNIAQKATHPTTTTTTTAGTMAEQQRAYRQYDSRGGIVNEAPSPVLIPPASVKGRPTSSSSSLLSSSKNHRPCDDGSCQPPPPPTAAYGEEGRAYSSARNVEEGAVEEAENDFSIHDGPVGASRKNANTNNTSRTDNDDTATNSRAPPTLEPYVGKLERYELFSTAQCYYLVACDKAGTGYRVLKMDRTLIERPDATSQARRVELEKRRREEQDAAAAVATSASGGGGDGMGAVGAAASSTSGNKSGMFPATNPAASSDGGASVGGGGPTDAPHGPNAHIRPLCEFCIEDPAVYSQDEIRDMLDMIHEGNKYTPGYDAPHGVGSGGSSGHAAGPGGHPRERPGGGLRPICKAYGVVGFVRFLDCYYLTLITKRAKVGSLGGNGIYTIKATETFPLKPAERPGQPSSGGGVSAGPIDFDRVGRDPTGAADGGKDPGTMLLSMWNRGKRSVGLGLTNREIAELRYQGLYQVVDLTKNFYFSYTYDVTRSLQENFLSTKSKPFPPPPFKDMYAWNYFLTRELEQCTNSMTSFQWVMPIIHGAFLQRRLNDYGRSMNLTLLARRSRHFAGTRYLKRGVSDQGKVANDVEHEQILHDEASSASAGAFSSYLQCRGSIPTYWTQESSVTLPKPPIILNRIDPTYHATQAHFGDLLRRYGSPIVVVDLVKQSEKREREVIVGNEYRSAIDHLNSHILDPEHKIRYCALDYSHISKAKRLNVSTSLNETATWAVNQTGFFCSHPRWTIEEGGKIEPFDDEAAADRVEMLDKHLGIPVFPMEQKGVLRTNCIDCLDRTNVAQFSAGVEALGQQLVVMGVRNSAKLDPSSNIVRVLIDMFVEIGDHIALQYGGSEAHKKVNTTAGPAASLNGPMGKHKELLTSIRRYYSNAFSDRLRQDAMNLFLGYYIPSHHTVPLWELESDYYLHNFHVKSGNGSLHAMRLYQRTFGTDWNDEDSQNSDKEGVLTTMENQESWRIERVRSRCTMQNEALSVWWKLAIQQYIQGRMWKSVGNTSSYESLLPSRFDRLYQPDKLAQFDKFFSRSWAAPVRLSHSAQHSHSGEDNTELMLLHRKAVVSAKNKSSSRKSRDEKGRSSDDEKRGDIDKDEEKSIFDFINAHGFKSELTPSLRLFLTSHKAYHQSIDGGFAGKVSSVDSKEEEAAAGKDSPRPDSEKRNNSLKGRKSEKSKKENDESSNDTPGLAAGLSFIGNLSTKANPCPEYLDYVNSQYSGCTRKSREEAREEFAKCLQESSLNADNVDGIRKLAESAHICSEISTGPYRGLRETDSAIGVTALVHEQLNNIDSMQKRGQCTSGGGLPGVDQDLRQRRMDKDSVKEAIYNGYSELNRSKQAYSEIIDTSSLGCRRSDLTDEKSMSLYCSFFDQDTPLSKLNKTYITGKSLPTDSFSSSRQDRKLNDNSLGQSASKSRWSLHMAEKRSPSLFSKETRRFVPEGFEQINDDMFARRDNRFVVFNGTGLDTWRKDSKEPRTKTHGLEDDIAVL